MRGSSILWILSPKRAAKRCGLSTPPEGTNQYSVLGEGGGRGGLIKIVLSCVFAGARVEHFVDLVAEAGGEKVGFEHTTGRDQPVC